MNWYGIILLCIISFWFGMFLMALLSVSKCKDCKVEYKMHNNIINHDEGLKDNEN